MIFGLFSISQESSGLIPSFHLCSQSSTLKGFTPTGLINCTTKSFEEIGFALNMYDLSFVPWFSKQCSRGTMHSFYTISGIAHHLQTISCIEAGCAMSSFYANTRTLYEELEHLQIWVSAEVLAPSPISTAQWLYLLLGSMLKVSLVKPGTACYYNINFWNSAA